MGKFKVKAVSSGVKFDLCAGNGQVIATSPEEGKVIVAGANVVSKHTKARRQGENSQIVKTEAAMYASKVQLYCEKCKKPTRAAHKIDGEKKTRVCTKCGAEL